MERAPLTTAVGLAGLGLVAGLAGTLAMTLSQKAEMAITRREPSETPAEAIEALAGIEPSDEQQKQRLSDMGHLAFGATLGLGLAALAKVPEPARGVAFLAGAWGTGTALTSELDLNDPPTEWEPQELAIDLAHHAVYAAMATGVFLALRRLAKI